MSGPTYRIPTAKVFLQSDGMIVPSPTKGSNVINATLAQAPLLTATYVGGGLHLNDKNLGDLILGDLGANAGTREGLKHLVEASEFIVLVGDMVELGVKMADWMGLLPPEPDPVMALLNWLDKRLNEIEDLALQSWASSRRDLIAFLRAHSTTALQFAQGYLEAGRPYNDPVWAAKLALADRDSLLAVNTFVDSGIDGGFWMRPFSWKALGINQGDIYSNWFGYYPNQAQIQKNPVWDFRFTLLATSYAIVARLAVLKAAFPESLAHGRSGCREMKRYANFLRSVAERMHNGIWAIEDLDLSEVGRFLFLWDGRMPVAAANIYSGHSLFRRLWAGDFPLLSQQQPGLWPSGLTDPHDGGGNNDAIIKRGRENAYKIGRHWWYLIYREIGMIELCKLIGDLDRACVSTRYSSFIGDAQKTLLRAQSDPGAKKAASVATALERFSSENPTPDAIQTFEIYQSLQEGGKRAREIVADCVDQLMKLVPSSQPERLNEENVKALKSRRKSTRKKTSRKS